MQERNQTLFRPTVENKDLLNPALAFGTIDNRG